MIHLKIIFIFHINDVYIFFSSEKAWVFVERPLGCLGRRNFFNMLTSKFEWGSAVNEKKLNCEQSSRRFRRLSERGPTRDWDFDYESDDE